MNTDTAVVEQPAAPVLEPEPAEEPAPLSILEHAAVHGPAPKDETPEQAEERVQKAHHSAQQRRERETGRFDQGRVRHRAASQQGRPDDVAAIGDLTRRIKAAEAAEGADITIKPGESQRVFELRRRAEVLERRRQSPPAATSAPAVSPAIAASPATTREDQRAPARADVTGPASAFREPEPDENDAKFAGDYAKYLRAVSAWEGRKAFHEAREGERQRDAATQFSKSHDERLKASQAKYADFDAVAERTIQRIPPRSIVEQYVFTRKAGHDVLYHLGQHPHELDAIVQMPDGADQFEALTLLAQRLASPPASAAGSTTSAPARSQPIVLPPKPANVVRTEAQRASDSPPPTDGSLSMAEHAKAFGRRR